jgi:hypothetical protein
MAVADAYALGWKDRGDVERPAPFPFSSLDKKTLAARKSRHVIYNHVPDNHVPLLAKPLI